MKSRKTREITAFKISSNKEHSCKTKLKMPLVIVKLKYFHHIIFQNIDTDNGPYGLKFDIYRYLGIPPNRQVFDSFKISDGKLENWMVET